jgi:hypothetical protein
MPAKTASEHVREVMIQVDKVQALSADNRNRVKYVLYGLFKAIQSGSEVIAPLYPDTDLVTPVIENYRKTLKPADILDDQPGPFLFGF